MRKAAAAALAALLALASCMEGPPEAPEARLIGAFRMDGLGRGDAGLSGLHVGEGGASLLALDDRSFLHGAAILREGGRPVGIGPATEHALRQADGRPMYAHDSEGMAVLPDGRVAVSYEGLNAIFLHDPANRWIGPPLDRPVRLVRLSKNEGLEALAAFPDGGLLAISEASRFGRHLVWRIDADGGWRPIGGLRSPGPFRPVGADIGPDGRLWLLERAWHLPLRFATRVRTLRVEPDRLSDPRTVLETRVGEWGNFEGISVRAAPGGTVVALVSDDNGLGFLPAHYAEFLVPDPLDTVRARD